LSLKTLYYETGLIEENDFYINLPNPFKSIVYRKNYISKINNIVDSIINGEKNDLYNEYYTLKKAY
jgi:hypothetical protein